MEEKARKIKGYSDYTITNSEINLEKTWGWLNYGK